MALQCPSCGRENNDDAALCLHCGAVISRGTKKLTLIDNRYEVLSTVKAGAMGCVYKARDTRLDSIVALKKMLPYFTTPEELKYAEERFREEAKLLSKLHHGGLPKVSDYFAAMDYETGKPAHYLVMTFIEGEDLENFIAKRRPPYSPDEVVRYARRLLEILTYLHSQSPPVIYRDLNPRNIIEKGGDLFLVDFGIAKPMKSEHKGTAIGTPGYASPEQYKGFAEPRSDIYSLGVLMHYLLTGANPEDSSRPLFTFESIRILNPRVPEYLDKLITSMLDVIPDNRPSSAEQVRTILEKHSMPVPQIQVESSHHHGKISEANKNKDLAAQNKATAALFQSPASISPSAGFLSRPSAPDSLSTIPLVDAASSLTGSASDSHLPSYRDLQKRKHRPAALQFDRNIALIYISLIILVATAVTIAIYPTATDPKRRLQNMGVRYSGDDFISSARTGKTKAVELFLASGMDPKTKGIYGETALHWACGEDKSDVVELLLSKNVDVNARTLNGLTPLQWAAQFGVHPVGTAKLLVEKGADVRIKTKEGWTALHWCAFKNDEEMSQLLISKGADVNAACSNGWTPLHIAAQGGHKATAQTLLNNSAKVDMKDKDGWTPLFWAIQEGHTEIVELLISRSAQVNVKDREGDTPLKVARRDGKKDIAGLLTKHGAK